jgi:hypothetical protein
LLAEGMVGALGVMEADVKACQKLGASPDAAAFSPRFLALFH